MNRLFRLDGQPFDLDDLLDLFSTGSWQVVRYEFVSYLSLEIAEGLDDQQAIALAEDNLSIMNGICLLHSKDYQSVRISGIGKRDPVTGKVIVSAYATVSGLRLRLRGKGVLTGLRADGTVIEPEPSATKSRGAGVLEAANNDPALQRALFLYGKLGHNWRELCLVLDAIEEANGGEAPLLKKPWTDSRLKELKKTANSFKAIGHEARHGKTATGISSPSITLTEAREVVKAALIGWIEELL